MKTHWQKHASLAIIVAFAVGLFVTVFSGSRNIKFAAAQTIATPTPTPAEFDQKAAIAKLREQIKGKENEPAAKVFKNLQMPMLKDGPAGRVLAVMEFGYARSLGVNCTHCHVPEKWESEDKPQKQIAREMQAMVFKISGEMLKDIKGLGERATVNCTTCHRGEIKPALNLPIAK